MMVLSTDSHQNFTSSFISLLLEGPLDTTADLVTKRTYIPSLTTFEEDIYRAMDLESPDQTQDQKGTDASLMEETEQKLQTTIS